MKFKNLLFLIPLIFILGCEQYSSKSDKINFKPEKKYKNIGFALIYNDDLKIKKIDQRSLIIFNNKLKKDTDIKITNLLNEKYLIAKVGKSSKYPIFYNSVISERIATELDIDPDQPYVRVETINSSNTFVANKAKTFDEEKKVANKAPVDSISIQNISIEKDNNSKVEKVKNTKFEFIIKFADLFFEESAITLKKRLEDEYNLKDINIKKMSKNLYMEKIGEKAKLASLNLSNLNIDKRNSVLKQFGQYLRTNSKSILNSNKKDISNAKSKKIKDSMINRLKLNSEKISQIKFYDLDEITRKTAAMLFMDGIAVAVAGAQQEKAPKVLSEHIKSLGGDPQATVFSFGYEASLTQAAYVNGASMHVLDYEPMWNPPNHQLSTCLPAILALAEFKELDGKAVLTALVKGTEMMCRLRWAAPEQRDLNKNRFHPPGYVGPMGRQ